ncbi:sugar kinase [Leifsonia sp. NPDC080035]|uniref:Sugar kinase n=1 Tax=Leifsonia sp. NPDC080035 TaxID=3143936 RepID=A0AAU7GIQ0_9MICO
MPTSDGPIVTIGEAMIALYPDGRHSLAEARSFGSDVGGAEFNVATTLARLGIPSAWVSRLGDDGFGDRILTVAAEAGVDTSAVERDAGRATGLYVKEPTTGADGVRTRMHYYRSGSAASALDSSQLGSAPAAALLTRAAIVHTSGITAALSASTAEAVAGLRAAVGAGTVVSVDLNLRPQLWRDRDTAPLGALIDQADLLLVGRDEAVTHFGHAEAADIFDAHPGLSTIVVKDEAHRASVYRREGRETHVPCLTVEVVEPVGAGDAFAAGFLAALAEGREDAVALRFGHALASLTLIGHGDRPLTVPTAGERERIAAATEDEWAGWRVHPGEIPWREASGA